MDDYAFRLALTGDFQRWHNQTREDVLKGIRYGAESMADYAKQELRSALVESGLKLNPKTWQAEIYPAHGLAWEPVVFVYSKAPKIIAAFDEGGEIHARSGYLAVPLPYYAEKLPRQRGQNSKSKIELTYDKYGEDNLVVLPATDDRPAILALKSGGITKRGSISARKKTKTGKHRRGSGVIPLFFLVSSVTLQQRLNIEASYDRIEREAPRLFAEGLARYLGSIH